MFILEMFAARRARIHIARAAKMFSLNARAIQFCKTGSKMGDARIAVKRYTESGNDTQEIHQENYNSGIRDYCGYFVAGKQSFAAQIREGLSG